MRDQNKARVIAFYLPQFHPIPENDKWWGNGFTEWTNVAKAKPLFRGHYQPHIPADLGFYDLRLPEVRQRQAEMARESGVEGFCYWHYWFGGGRRLLERPFDEVLASGEPDYPFCLGWANETWSGIWHGNPSAILIEQTYPGDDDYTAHFEHILPAFKDKRYIKVDGKPLFYLYRPLQLPAAAHFMGLWNDLARKNGFPGIHFVGFSASRAQSEEVQAAGFDAVHASWQKDVLLKDYFFKHAWNKAMEMLFGGKFKILKFKYPKYASLLADTVAGADANVYPTILAGWDNTPRSGRRGMVLTDYTPEAFGRHVEKVLSHVEGKDSENNIVFLKSWNEWAEGNYMEPDLKYGHGFLDVFKNKVKK